MFGRYSEGLETLVRLTRAEPIEYQIEPPEAGELDAFHRLQVKRPGPLRIVARHRGFEDSADLTALGDVRPPDIAWTGSTPNGLAVLRVTGSEGRTHLLEESGDLSNWSSVLTNRMPPSGHFFHTNGAASPRASFYRARLLVE